MNDKIKRISESLKIQKEKEKYLDSKKTIFKLQREMSDLTLDFEVGRYVHYLEMYLNILDNLKPDSDKRLVQEFIKARNQFFDLKTNENIEKYMFLKYELIILNENLNKYFKLININFRNELINNYLVPDIYVYCGKSHDTLYKNIIDPDNLLIGENESTKYIYPYYDVNSKRDLRHFYNKISFKYLEQLSNDYDFNVDNKVLGKIRIK